MRGNFCVRIPTGAKVVGGGRMMAIKTPFDFSASVGGQAVYFDAKSTAQNRFNIGSYVMATSKVHQFRQLMEAHRMGALAGYLIWFYGPTIRQIVWAPITVIGQPGLTSIAPGMDGTITQEDNRVIDLGRLTGAVSRQIVPRRTIL